MDSKLDELKTRLTQTEKDLAELQTTIKNLSEEEKKKLEKAEDINKAQEIENELTAIKTEIEELKSTMDVRSLEADFKRIKADYDKIIDDFDEELLTLQSAVDPNAATNQPSNNSEGAEKKGVKEWFKEQRDGLTSKEEWKQHPGTNIARAVSGVWAVSGIIWLGSRIFSRPDWEKEIEGYKDMSKKEKRKARRKWRKERRKKESFRERPFGRFLKWTTTAAAVVGGSYGVQKIVDAIKGKGSDATDTAEEQADDTVNEKENDPEKFEKHKGIGEVVDSQFAKIWKKEIDAGWGGMSIAEGYAKYADKNNIEIDVFQATVPMCIDNQFSDVNTFLSEGGFYSYIRGYDVTQIIDQFKGWTKEQIGKLLGPYLMSLTSFIPIKGKDWSEKLETWLKTGNPEDRQAELQLFFRQYAKVLNYFQDKLFCLKEIIAYDKRTEWDDKFSTVKDALDDEEWVQKHVYTDPRYKNFIKGKLYNAVDIMKNNGIFNDDLSEDMTKITSSCDTDRDEILKYQESENKDAIQRLQEAGENLTPEIQRECAQCCDDIIGDINHEFDARMLYMYFGATHTALNTKIKNIQDFLKYSGISDLKDGMIQSFNDYKQRFESGTITSEEIGKYKDLVNSYFATKKEIEIGSNAIQQMKSQNPNRGIRALDIGKAVLCDLFNHTKASIKHFREGDYLKARLLATFPLVAGGYVVQGIGHYFESPNVKKFGNFIKRTNIFNVCSDLVQRPIRYFHPNSLDRCPTLVLRARYNTNVGDKLLLQDLIEGRIHEYKAEQILEKGGNKKWKTFEGHKNASISDFLQTMLTKQEATMPGKYIDILFNNKEIVFMRNPSIRKIFFGEPKTTWVKGVQKVWRGFRQRSYTPQNFNDETFKTLEKFIAGGQSDSIFKKLLTPEQKIFAKHLLENGNFANINDINKFINTIKDYDLSNLDEKTILNLVDELAAHTDELGDMIKVNNRAKSIIGHNITVGPIDNLHYQSLVRDLEVAEYKIKGGMDADDLANLSPNQRKALADIDEFRQSLNTFNNAQLERADELLKQFKHATNDLAGAIDQFDTLRKLQGKTITSSVLDSHGNPIVRDLDDIIKNMDATALRGCKGGALGVTDEAIDLLASTFESIHRSHLINFASNINEIGDCLKIFIKVFAKIT